MNLLLAPILIPLATAVLCILTASHLAVQRALSLLGSLALLYATYSIQTAVGELGIQSVQMGNWIAPFGITLVADGLSATLALLASVVVVLVIVFGMGDLTRSEQKNYQAVFTHALTAGVCGAFFAGDLFNLYVWFEVMLIASFGLLVVGGKKQQIDGAVKYVGLNLIATTAMLAGIGLIYGASGTLNMADLHLALDGKMEAPSVLAGASLLLFAFAAKSAMFPLYFWLPAAYHTPSFTTSTLFAALLTKVGVYTLIRVFTLIFDAQHPLLQVMLWTSGIATLTLGVFGAMTENNARRVLAFLVMVSIGIMSLGLAAGTELALKGVLIYLMQTLIVTAALFMALGLVSYLSGTESLKAMGGLWREHPVIGGMFVIVMLGVAGIPPTSGFWPKLVLIDAFVQEARWGLVIAVLLGGLGTLYACMRMFSAAFWQTPVNPLPVIRIDIYRLVPFAVLVVLVVGLGAGAEQLLSVAQQAARELVDPQLYVQAVLGDAP